MIQVPGFDFDYVRFGVTRKAFKTIQIFLIEKDYKIEIRREAVFIQTLNPMGLRLAHFEICPIFFDQLQEVRTSKTLYAISFRGTEAQMLIENNALFYYLIGSCRSLSRLDLKFCFEHKLSLGDLEEFKRKQQMQNRKNLLSIPIYGPIVSKTGSTLYYNDRTSASRFLRFCINAKNAKNGNRGGCSYYEIEIKNYAARKLFKYLQGSLLEESYLFLIKNIEKDIRSFTNVRATQDLKVWLLNQKKGGVEEKSAEPENRPFYITFRECSSIFAANPSKGITIVALVSLLAQRFVLLNVSGVHSIKLDLNELSGVLNLKASSRNRTRLLSYLENILTMKFAPDESEVLITKLEVASHIKNRSFQTIVSLDVDFGVLHSLLLKGTPTFALNKDFLKQVFKDGSFTKTRNRILLEVLGNLHKERFKINFFSKNKAQYTKNAHFLKHVLEVCLDAKLLTFFEYSVKSRYACVYINLNLNQTQPHVSILT
jgi:hypothetical protein